MTITWCRCVPVCLRDTVARNDMQYHALCLLYHIRKSDRLAVNKMVQKFTKQGLRSPLAICYLIRIACKLLEDGDSKYSTPCGACNEHMVLQYGVGTVRLPRVVFATQERHCHLRGGGGHHTLAECVGEGDRAGSECSAAVLLVAEAIAAFRSCAHTQQGIL